jgi:hypothetical protein
MSKKPAIEDAYITIQEIHDLARVRKMPVRSSSLSISGNYALFIDVTATKETVFLPVSVASGRKSTGFIYYIEGNKVVSSAAQITVKGDGITMVAAGTIPYCKIPAGRTAHFRIFAEIDSKLPKQYRLVVSRINYKLNPNDPRYKRLITEISTNFVKDR